MEININDEVLVTVNPHGERYLTPLDWKQKLQEDGRFKFQLWALMERFGPHIKFDGSIPPIKTTMELVITERA